MSLLSFIIIDPAEVISAFYVLTYVLPFLKTDFIYLSMDIYVSPLIPLLEPFIFQK